MSTYLYLECLEHDPPLSSDGEVGQHLYDLPRIRQEITARDLIVALARSEIGYGYDSHFTSNAARFLAQHPNCHIGIRDEYGLEHPVVVEGPPERSGVDGTE